MSAVRDDEAATGGDRVDRPVAGPDGLRIRRAEPGDYAGFAATMETPKAVAGTLQLPYPSLDGWRERLARQDPAAFVVVAEMPAGPDAPLTIVGHAGLSPTGASARRRHAASLGISVRDAWHGQGIGHALLSAVLTQADRWMGLLRIELIVFVDNAPAIALYRRHGFEVEGTHRAHALKDGAYVDAYSMARLHPHPPSLPSRSHASPDGKASS